VGPGMIARTTYNSRAAMDFPLVQLPSRWVFAVQPMSLPCLPVILLSNPFPASVASNGVDKCQA